MSTLATPAKGTLVCDDCGKEFHVQDGQSILIDHFENCEGEE